MPWTFRSPCGWRYVPSQASFSESEMSWRVAPRCGARSASGGVLDSGSHRLSCSSDQWIVGMALSSILPMLAGSPFKAASLCGRAASC